MVLNQLDPNPIQDHQNIMLFSATTPPESTIDDLDPLHVDYPAMSSKGTSIPWPGNTFIIRSTSCGRVLSLSHGKVILANPHSSNDTSTHWNCVEEKGWFGFRNLASGKLLGHDWNGKLTCTADRQKGWEHWTVRQRPEGDYVLMLTHHDELWYVTTERVQGEERLGKIGVGGAGGMGWEFVKV